MTPEQHLEAAEQRLATAEESAAAAQWAQASAWSSIAAAHAAIAGQQRSSDGKVLYPGRHAPAALEWCRECTSPSYRYQYGEFGSRVACKRCNPERMPEVRPCRYCGTLLEKQHHPVNDRWDWADASGSRGCPKAPDPLGPEPKEELHPDFNRTATWATLLGDWHGYYGTKLLTASMIVESGNLLGRLPQNHLGYRCSAEQLDVWLEEHLKGVFETDAGFSVRLEKESENDVNRWRVTRVVASDA